MLSFDKFTTAPKQVKIGVLLLTGIYLLLIFINSWMSDDSYITFRTIYNFVHGYGLRWNITERVQTYTHPLWLMILLPGYWLTGHAYITALGNCLLFSMLAVIALFLQAKNYRQGLLAIFY